jgi:hypothetical protein
MISRPKDRERPKRREHSPPDPVFNAVADLFDWAANGVADPEAPHLLKYSDSKGKASPDALRFAVGLSGRWNFWPNASWQGGDVPMRQYYYNRVLIELFSGEPKSHPFDNGEANKNAILIFEYLRKDYPEELNSAVQFLKQYSADLLKNNKSAGKADRSSGKPTIAVEQTRSLPSRETAAFIGVQKDTSREQTAAINRCFKDVLVNADASDVPSSLSSLSFQLKHRTKGPALRDQKSVLYGRIPDAKLTLGPADFVDLKLTFNRTLSDKLFSYIGKLSDPFSSYTILARPGQGKSIALAQVLLNLLSTPGYWTFWSFDTNVAFECENGVKCIEKYIDLFRQSKCIPRRLIFIFDDIDRRSDYDAIHAFHSYCEQYSIANQMAISFLLSLTDYNLSITDNVFQLSLDTDDENRLYEVLLTEEPRMAGKAFDSIEDLLSVQ